MGKDGHFDPIYMPAFEWEVPIADDPYGERRLRDVSLSIDGRINATYFEE
jgi:hypothetical protein